MMKREDDFVVVRGDVRINVSYVSGSSSRCTLRVPYNRHARRVATSYRDSGPLRAIRPMNIALRPETASHRSGKASGMDVEVQTGDPAFDGAVYVDTLTPADVAVHVLGEPVRRAVLDLFAIHFTLVTIDDSRGDIVAEIVSFVSLTPTEKPGERA